MASASTKRKVSASSSVSSLSEMASDGWASLMQEQTASKVQPVPDDWWRLGRIAKELGVTERTASKVVATAIAHGKAQKQRFTINGTGGIQSVWHFRLKK